MGDADILFSVRNSFHLGAYQNVINEGSDLTELTSAESIERDVLVYRSYIAQGSNQIVIDEIKGSSPTSLQAVKLLALYRQSPGNRESVLETLQEWLANPSTATDPTLLLIAGIVYSAEGNLVDALKCVHGGSTLEMMAVTIQAFLRMDRVDYAEKTLKGMQSTDDDAILTQLATAWVNLALGGSKIQEAFFIFQELGDKYSWTPKLRNGSAISSMQMGNFDEAEKDLLDALNKDSKDPETLANLVTCTLHLGKPGTRYLNQLKSAHPEHLYVTRYSSAEEAFDRAAQVIA